MVGEGCAPAGAGWAAVGMGARAIAGGAARPKVTGFAGDYVFLCIPPAHPK